MIAWFARNSVAANLLMIAVMGAGLISLKTGIPLEMFPTFDRDQVSIEIALPGATPEDVESSITVRAEEAVQDLQGLKELVSTSAEGSARLDLEMEKGTDKQAFLAEVKSRIDRIDTFPIEAERPVISLAQSKRYVLTISIASKYGEKETLEYAQGLRDEMLRLPGVTQLELWGVRDLEILIEIPQARLRQHDLTLEDVSTAIQGSSQDVSAGRLRTSGGDILLRTRGLASTREDFARIPIRTSVDGSTILLNDIAHIQDGFDETPLRSWFNGKDAVFINVYHTEDQNILDISERVQRLVEEKRAMAPDGYQLIYWYDTSEHLKSRITTLLSSALEGGILVMILLTLFLRPAVAFWVLMGIPLSFMGAFIVMPYFDVSFNIVSLFAFIMVLGIVVDDAIVTGENIYSHVNASTGPIEDAVVAGTREVATPVTFGILTTVAAFCPLFFMEDDKGPIFSHIPLVVIPILLFSLVESKLILPAHLKHLKRRESGQESGRFEAFQRRFADGFENVILEYYQPVLRVALTYKLITLSSFLVVLAIIVSLLISGWMRYSDFPSIPADDVTVDIQMPAGTPFEVTNKHVLDITANVEALKAAFVNPRTGNSLLDNTLSISGRGGDSAAGRVRVEIVAEENEKLNIPASEIAEKWRELNGEIPGAEIVTYRTEFLDDGPPIDIKVSARDLAVLQQVADQTKLQLATFSGVLDISDTFSDGKQELFIELTELGKAAGLTREGVARQVRNAFFGVEAQRIQRGRDDIKVSVQLPLTERRSVADLESLLIRTPDGNGIPLANVITLSPGVGPSEIQRIDRFRTVSVTADIDRGSINMTSVNAGLESFLDTLIQQYPGVTYEMGGLAESREESFESLGIALAVALFAIYALLAIPFKSYAQPLVVMSVIPFGLIGAVIGHFIMGEIISIISILGMIALIGIVINDSLVLVDYINKRRQKTDDLMEAVLSAGAARFRAVMLTSITTFFGLLPLLFETSLQAQFVIPMAISLGFGILFATLLTLVMVPVNYMLLEEVKASLAKKLGF